MTDLQSIQEAVIAGDPAAVTEKVQAGLEAGSAAGELLSQGLIAAMDIVGERMEKEEMFIPEVLMAAQAMAAGVELLKPLLGEDETASKGKVVIGTVKGDLHDIGKNLVAMMLESSGLKVYNLGVDIAPEEFARQVEEKRAGILCLSALLTTTMPMMKQTIEALSVKGLREQVKVMVGGAPVTQTYADEIGADGYAPDAGSATKIAKAFIL